MSNNIMQQLKVVIYGHQNDAIYKHELLFYLILLYVVGGTLHTCVEGQGYYVVCIEMTE